MGCRCKSSVVSVKKCNGCIVAGYHIIHSADSVGPCGQEGEFDLNDMANAANNVSTCGGSLIYSIEDWDSDGFEIVTKTGSVISFVTKTDAVPGQYYTIHFSVKCASKGLSDLGLVRVGIKNMCYGADCTQGQVCNPCTGGCVDETANVSV